MSTDPVARPPVNLWGSAEHALAYLGRADRIPHRTEGEATLLELLPERVERVLDLGTGDGRLAALVLAARPDATVTGLDLSDTMLARAAERFAGDERVVLQRHDLDDALPDLGRFDAVVSSFAIHHVSHPRKRALYGEAVSILEPGGLFANLEHVASPTEQLHTAFLVAIGNDPADDDPSNQLLDVATQLAWLGEAGLDDVDCYWKWRELALLAGRRPA
ncbi:MAG: class I SAM-dependent methyltransferase [Acidimicrobiales bacterium]|nr:class I SAM-dependent methyltransferase [Acidimicrobiales bacterium]